MAEQNAGVPSRPPIVVPSLSDVAMNKGTNGAASVLITPAPMPKKKTAPPPESKDSFREIVETVVFVVVLVLLLKAFVAEAFVIPTGSMAETLWGYQKLVTCPKCGEQFPVNCSCEVDPQQQPPSQVVGCICPNCEYVINFRNENMNPGWNSGDRVLVGKFFYDLPGLGFDMPQRYQVVVFKFPREPQHDYVSMNYIKRGVGLQRETIAIHYGKLYAFEGLNYDDEDRSIPKEDLWKFTHKNDPAASELFHQGKFHILRKPPKTVLAERRLVFDNDHQPKDLVGKVPPRWQARKGWEPDNTDKPLRFKHASGADTQLSWLRYQHLRRDPQPSGLARLELITDFMGYNNFEEETHTRRVPAQNWVGDLLLECDVDVAEAKGELVLELSKGVDRFHARWDLASGMCTLERLGAGRGEEKLEAKDTPLKKPGKYRLRFANVDNRLLVWVDNSLPFGDGVVYEAPNQLGPTKENDLEPASIGVRGGAVTVSGLKLWRDTYYTTTVDQNGPDCGRPVDLGNPAEWEPLQTLPVASFYVQPGHILCMGDNSPESSDGRTWGLVPRRLLLGRALMVYWPYNRAGRIE